MLSVIVFLSTYLSDTLSPDFLSRTFAPGYLVGPFKTNLVRNSLLRSFTQIGNVILEDHVEIGANCSIDRATMGSTIIRKGVKLDNQIQIAHNVEIGHNTVIAAQTGIAGSTKIGSQCLIGGQVGFAGHLTIGNNVRIQAQSGVGRNIKDNETIQGSPSFNYGDFSKSYVHFKNLPKIMKRFNAIEKKINDE